jgi:hypothetical protein
MVSTIKSGAENAGNDVRIDPTSNAAVISIFFIFIFSSVGVRNYNKYEAGEYYPRAI